jgi:hypothetical protein
MVLTASVAACGGDAPSQDNEAGTIAAEGSPPALNVAEAQALADEAAADEAADTNLFGGNAAAGETGTLQ